MRSYYAHLDSAKNAASETKRQPIAPRPIYRSSAIFPCMHFKGIKTRILFMGYWLLKRNIKEIACIVTVRSEGGAIITRSQFPILDAKTYRIELEDQLNALDDPPKSFTGSMEIEFFSTSNLVFPYPAVVVNYYGDKFSSVVHTAQRTYNDFEDMRNNSETSVPESGFNIYADKNQEPFFAMCNGGEIIPETKLKMTFYNHAKETLEKEINLGKTYAYQTRFIYPAKEVDLIRFLGNRPGAAKVAFQLKWVFQRLLVGNIDHSLPAVTITHTYYDCTKAISERDYWKKPGSRWYPASLMLPVTIEGDHFTNIYFYPIYSPSTFIIDAEIYNAQGKLISQKTDLLTITSPSEEYHSIDLKDLCKKLGVKPEKHLAARLIAREKGDLRIPARIKLGLDLGSKAPHMPCNICTNLQPFNPQIETKPTSFKWAPLLADQPEAVFWIMNSAPIVDYDSEATVDLTFFREQDTSTIVRKVNLPPNGFLVVSVQDDPELKAFFGGQIGWVTAITSNPYTTTYYFDENTSGVVGGDHGF